MKSCCDSTTRRFSRKGHLTVLLFAVLAFLAVALPGCLDPVVADMRAEHENLGRICQQELRQAGYGSPRANQTETLFPAP